jgi:hypothetical protein
LSFEQPTAIEQTIRTAAKTNALSVPDNAWNELDFVMVRNALMRVMWLPPADYAAICEVHGMCRGR